MSDQGAKTFNNFVSLGMTAALAVCGYFLRDVYEESRQQRDALVRVEAIVEEGRSTDERLLDNSDKLTALVAQNSKDIAVRYADRFTAQQGQEVQLIVNSHGTLIAQQADKLGDIKTDLAKLEAAMTDDLAKLEAGMQKIWEAVRKRGSD